MQQDTEFAICFHCGAVNTAIDAHSWDCKYCGSIASTDTHSERKRLGGRLHLYAKRYRDRYEQDFKEHDSLPCRYSMWPSGELLEFVALAVASGVVGNASWDLIKLVIKKAANAVRDAGPDALETGYGYLATPDELDAVFELLADDTEFDQYCADISDFLDGMPRATPAVRKAIITAESAADFKKQVQLTAPELLPHREG